MRIQLSDHFTYARLFRFVLPSIAMMVFTSVYGIVDGFFVSNFAGKTAFAAVNFIIPFIMILSSVGFMFGTGGCALISKEIGEGKKEKAQKTFSMIVLVSFITGIVLAVIGIIAVRPVAAWLGAEGEMLDNCVFYGRIVLTALPAYVLQYEFQSFFIAAEKPRLGLFVTLAAGIMNMALDWLLVGVFSFGLGGAAAASSISIFVGGFVPVIYFIRPNSSLLRLVKPAFDGRALLKTCTNGSSELLSNVAMSVCNIFYNARLMTYIGEDGVSAFGVMMYVGMIFYSVFMGYAVGTSPIISYNYGAENYAEKKNVFRKSLVIITAFSAAMVIASLLLSGPMSYLYVGYDETLFEITKHGFMIFSFSFIFAGMAIYSSSFFTALNNGLVSAVISFLRMLVFPAICVYVLPLILGVDGIWLSLVVSEFLSVIVDALVLAKFKGRYRY